MNGEKKYVLIDFYCILNLYSQFANILKILDNKGLLRLVKKNLIFFESIIFYCF